MSRKGTKYHAPVSHYMLFLSVPWDLRSLWALLTVAANFYTICLLAGATYSTYSVARILVSLRRRARNKAVVTELNKRKIKTQSLREFHTMLFLLFGLCASNKVLNIRRGIQISPVSMSAARIDVFEPVIALVFFAFAVLLLLHGFRWAVAHRLRAATTGN